MKFASCTHFWASACLILRESHPDVGRCILSRHCLQVCAYDRIQPPRAELLDSLCAVLCSCGAGQAISSPRRSLQKAGQLRPLRHRRQPLIGRRPPPSAASARGAALARARSVLGAWSPPPRWAVSTPAACVCVLRHCLPSPDVCQLSAPRRRLGSSWRQVLLRCRTVAVFALTPGGRPLGFTCGEALDGAIRPRRLPGGPSCVLPSRGAAAAAARASHGSRSWRPESAELGGCAVYPSARG